MRLDFKDAANIDVLDTDWRLENVAEKLLHPLNILWEILYQ